MLRTGVRQIEKKNENIAIFILFFFLTAKINEKQGAPLLTEKHPFIDDAKLANFKHEVALTMN